MKSTSAFVGLASVVAVTVLWFSGEVAIAEKLEQTYVKTNFRTASKSSIMVGDRELAQEVTISDIKYSAPGFNPSDEWVLVQTDYVSGTGTHRAYYVDTFPDGSQTFGTSEGTTKTTANPDGTWETTWQGSYRYSGGTGKYKNIKGGGTYKGRVSSKEPAIEEGRETIEY